jgi:hypothetical protein
LRLTQIFDAKGLLSFPKSCMIDQSKATAV